MFELNILLNELPVVVTMLHNNCFEISLLFKGHCFLQSIYISMYIIYLCVYGRLFLLLSTLTQETISWILSIYVFFLPNFHRSNKLSPPFRQSRRKWVNLCLGRVNKWVEMTSWKWFWVFFISLHIHCPLIIFIWRKCFVTVHKC